METDRTNSRPESSVNTDTISRQTASKVGRRELLGGAAKSAAAGAAGAFGIPMFVPASALANPRKGRIGANDKIITGHIGVGGMGRSHVRPDAAMICDVDDNHANEVANAVEKNPKRTVGGRPDTTRDFRKLLERKDIDAVSIGTPDHWHAIMCVMACQAGKHVYTEKPVCKTIEEGRAMVNAARRYNRVVQVGMQGRSNPDVAAAVRYARNGMLGKIKRVEIWHPINFSTTEYYKPTEVPANLDWDMWLGPARWTSYHPLKAHFNFRWFWDSGEGFIRDRGNHAINCVSWMTGMDSYKGQVACRATGTPKTEGMYDVPQTMRVEWTFSDPQWTLVWDQPGKPNPHMPGDWGATYYGDRDDLILHGGDGGAKTEEKAYQYKAPSSGFDPYLFPAETGDNTERHRLNWFDCIRTGKRPAADIEIGFTVITLPIVGNIAYRLGRPVTYDYASERFVNDEEANRFLSLPYRAPWKV